MPKNINCVRVSTCVQMRQRLYAIRSKTAVSIGVQMSQWLYAIRSKTAVSICVQMSQRLYATASKTICVFVLLGKVDSSAYDNLEENLFNNLCLRVVSICKTSVLCSFNYASSLFCTRGFDLCKSP